MVSGVSSSLVIHAPAEKIFAILADPHQHSKIDGSGTVVGVKSGPDRLELGSQFAMDMKMGAAYSVPNTVVEFDEGRRIAWRHKAPQRWRYELRPAGQGTGATGATEVTETWDISGWPPVLRQGLKAVMGGKTKRGIEETLQLLKKAAEA